MTLPAATIDIIGGVAVLGCVIVTGADMVALIRRGIPFAAAEFIVESGRLSANERDRVVIPRKTLAHRQKLGVLTPEQSDRLVRVARVMAAAEETFGSRDKASAWLRRPTSALGGERPLLLLDTDEGARQVENLLGRIGHGIAA